MSFIFDKKNRRAFLRNSSGLGLMMPFAPFADFYLRPELASSASGSKKLICAYFPNGCPPQYWNFNEALAPLAKHQKKMTIIAGLINQVSEDNSDDAHAQGGANLWTGSKLVGKSNKEGTGVSGESIDQIASRTLDKSSILQKPIVTGVWRGFAGGQNRVSCWYRRSWKFQGNNKNKADPVTPIGNPFDIYKLAQPTINIEKKDDKQAESNALIDKSILDTVLEEYKSLTQDRSQLNAASKEIFRQHLDKVRQLEKKAGIVQKEMLASCPKTKSPKDFGGMLFSYQQFDEIYKLQMDLVTLAFQCGVTNTANLMFCSAGESYVNSKITRNNDHQCSHHKTDEGKRKSFIELRKYHMSNIVHLLENLEAVETGAGKTMLDETVIMVGSEFGDSQFAHTRSPQPHLVLGMGGEFQHNQKIDCKGKNTPNDLYRQALQALDVPTDGVGEKKYNGDDLPKLRV